MAHDSGDIGGTRRAAERILAIRDHGRAELRTKLLRRGFEEEPVRKVLEELERLGWLNDREYAETLARRELDRGRGLNYIRAKLVRRGVSVEPACATPAEEEASLKRLLKKKNLTREALTGGPQRAKILRFLRGRGYTLTTVSAIVHSEDED